MRQLRFTGLIAASLALGGMGMFEEAPTPIPAACAVLEAALDQIDAPADLSLIEGVTIAQNEEGISLSSCDAETSSGDAFATILLRQDMATDRDIVPSAPQLEQLIKDTSAAMGFDVLTEPVETAAEASAWIQELGQVVAIHNAGRTVLNVGPGVIGNVSQDQKDRAAQIVSAIATAYP